MMYNIHHTGSGKSQTCILRENIGLRLTTWVTKCFSFSSLAHNLRLDGNGRGGCGNNGGCCC